MSELRIHRKHTNTTGAGGRGLTRAVAPAVTWLQDTSKRKLACFSTFFAPPVPVSPGLPEDDPTIDKNKRPGLKNWVD